MLSGKYLAPLLHLRNNGLGEMAVHFFFYLFLPPLSLPPRSKGSEKWRFNMFDGYMARFKQSSARKATERCVRE